MRTGPAWVGLVIGGAIALVGIGIAYRLWVAEPGIAARLRERLAPLHAFLVNKWYFDELIELIVVRPALWLGGLVSSVIERLLIGEVVTGGPVGAVRAGSAAVRRAQTGFLRYYAAAMIACLAGVALYFLISSS